VSRQYFCCGSLYHLARPWNPWSETSLSAEREEIEGDGERENTKADANPPENIKSHRFQNSEKPPYWPNKESC
jgi:hypothetical protein